MSYLFAFSYCLWGSYSRNTTVVAIPFSSGPRLSELSTVTRLSWVALHGMAYGFIELHKPLHHDKAGDQWRGLLALMKLIFSLLSFYIINLTQI